MFSIKKNFFLRENGREGGGEKGERERKIVMREPHLLVVSLTHPNRSREPATQVRVLHRNRTCNPLVRKPMLSPLIHADQGSTPPLDGKKANPLCTGLTDRVRAF